mgnify:CR=1 FL=1
MMKIIKWKTLIITGIVCLLPIFLGLLLWDKLPETMAIHFDINNKPDNFAPKGFVVFGIPVLMLLLQVICCVINDVNAYKYGDRVKFEMATKWIIPVWFGIVALKEPLSDGVPLSGVSVAVAVEINRP